jgi:hypothetical protein
LAQDIKQRVIEHLLPSLKKHVLRVGIGSGKATVASISSLFTLEELNLVEDVHLELEKCRNRIVQAQTLRQLEERSKNMFKNRKPKRADLYRLTARRKRKNLKVSK